jgi:hypothetical protein
MTTVQTINIPKYCNIKLNSFHPLCGNDLGQQAIRIYNLPPFIDASCRREPDLQNDYPSISALCRKKQFAPTLKPNDIIVYLTVKGDYTPYDKKHHRLVAILQVEKVFTTHSEGQIGYSQLKVQTPSNCMVKGNDPLDFDKTAGNFDQKTEMNKFLNRSIEVQKRIGQRRIQLWEKEYLERSQHWTCFVQTRKLYCELTNPKPIFPFDFETIIGRSTPPRQPKKLSEQEFKQLAKLAGIEISLGEKKGSC